MTMIPFTYREFYDVPRAILVEWHTRRYFLDSSFDDATGEYPEFYVVYELDRAPDVDSLSGDWSGMQSRGTRRGIVRVADVQFDATRRESIDSSVFDSMGARHGGDS